MTILIGRFAGAAVFLMLVMLSLTAMRAPAFAESGDEARGVISKQLDALKRDAWDEAYSYASDGVKRSFPNSQRFAEMVRRGYPMVWRPQSTQFLDSAEGPGGSVVQRLRIVGPDNMTYIATYLVSPSPDGWKISGVRIEKALDAS